MSESKYEDWIKENVFDGTGRCLEFSMKMKEVFPELKLVRGHYICYCWGKRDHWWLKTEEGVLVDPTKNQFPSKGSGEYEEWCEGREEPTGRCLNCRKYVYENEDFCCIECKEEFSWYL